MALAFAPNDYSLFGGAQYVSPGNASARAVQLISSTTVPYSGIDYGVGSTTKTFADITHLSTDYMFEAGSCGGGSPRFQINVVDPTATSTTKNIFVYLGDAPNYTNCPTGVWTNSGELIGSSTVDTSQLTGGTFYDTYAHALATYGTWQVTGVQLVADAGWAFPATGQVVDVDNTVVATTTYTYEEVAPPVSTVPTTAAQCRNGGYATLTDNNGKTFKNQGDCISFVASKGKNTGSGI